MSQWSSIVSVCLLQRILANALHVVSSNSQGGAGANVQRMYKEVQHALRSLFVLAPGGGGGGTPEWQLQLAPLGQRSAVREAELPAAVAGGERGETSDAGGGASVSGGQQPAPVSCKNCTLFLKGSEGSAASRWAASFA